MYRLLVLTYAIVPIPEILVTAGVDMHRYYVLWHWCWLLVLTCAVITFCDIDADCWCRLAPSWHFVNCLCRHSLLSLSVTFCSPFVGPCTIGIISRNLLTAGITFCDILLNCLRCHTLLFCSPFVGPYTIRWDSAYCGCRHTLVWLVRDLLVTVSPCTIGTIRGILLTEGVGIR